MSLTAALAIVAAVVLAAIVIQGVWAARRGRPAPRPPAPTTRIEPAIDAAAATLPPVPAARRVPRLDALIDAIVALAVDVPVTGEQVLAHLPASRRAGSKPFYIEGRDAETGEWTAPRPGRRYAELQAGVQLANRGGPLNEIEYSEFVQKVQSLADSLGATPEVADMIEVVSRARELDAHASALDAQLAVTLRSDAVAWSVGFLQQIGQRHGFVAGAVPGRLVRPAQEPSAPPLLVLSFDAQAALADEPQRSAVRECQLSLDVPQTPAEAEPFPAWHDAARQLADDLAASMVDDFGEPITLHAFAGIGQELKSLYDRLEALGLPAGSAAARRLFS